MRALAPLFALLVMLVSSELNAQGQPKAKAPVGPEVRYFTYLSGLMDDKADVILRETRQGGRVIAAHLDVCFPTPANADRTDRFSLDLTINGERLTGTTQSQDDKLPVSVSLVRKPNGKAFDFTGSIGVGKIPHTIASIDTSDVSEREFKEQQSVDDTINATPTDFTSVSPEAIAVKLKKEMVTEFVKGFRGENIQVALYGLIASCAELRSGEQVLRLTVDPDRAQATIAAVRGRPGVIAAGWTEGNMDMERTLRFAANRWREAGKINREKIAQTVSDNLAKSLSATFVGSKWNDTTGELTVSLKRASAVLPELGLTETISIVMLVSADRPGPSDHLLLWIGSPSIETIDAQTGPRLMISDNTSGNDEESVSVNDEQVLAALAGEFQARRWDSETSAWK